jgi:hypothetical protein
MPIPYAIDPTLHSGPPPSRQLGDGFEAPPRQGAATHPVEPEDPPPGQPEPAEPHPNPSRLPVEPEFEPQWRPVEPEVPGSRPPLP